ncbi:FAD-binding protein [Flavobacteriaceae bacterium F08102]|nr:FAD-binding protein [Flavobacteriaceae bacterium F08102]
MAPQSTNRIEPIKADLQSLANSLAGDLSTDTLHQQLYATDASVYRKLPLAVAFPKNREDLQQLIHFANKHQISLVPRAAGTSLAGQCVGEGIIVDTSKHFTKILEFDEQARTVTVQPGVIRDELNAFLKPYGLFFGPNTSTSNRCMIGGMVGNNSSGTTSIQYGVTRDKVLKMTTLLSDGSEVVFGALTADEFKHKLHGTAFENKIYRTINDLLQPREVQDEIVREFPKKSIHRRNTGYAVDALIQSAPFTDQGPDFNMAKLLCGSEGTLAFTTSITLQLDPLPPKEQVIIAAHFTTISESLSATLLAMKHNLHTCELMDRTILDCTKNNREQLKNRDFVEGDPGAILLLELKAETIDILQRKADTLIADLKQHQFGYAYPLLFNAESEKAFALRKAGLGLLGNIVGDKKAVACIEDTAVDLADLPAYIEEFTAMMDRYGQDAVYYAHAGAGEIHLRPLLNLKDPADVGLFKTITEETAKLVKKYKGSFSGEHGDGIVRGAFVHQMVGDKNYALLRKIKHLFDPKGLFNNGKIIDAYPMDASLRYEVGREEPVIDTFMDFSDSMGILRAVEKCNGSGDCRKSANATGVMCPSYRATRNEKDTTRGRANVLREILTHSTQENKFDHHELKEVFDLCLSCKACASECPSNVDIASFKAEFLHQYHKQHPPSFREKMMANNAKYNALGSKVPRLTNFILNTRLAKNIMGIAPKRSIPKLAPQTLSSWIQKNKQRFDTLKKPKGELYFFNDEFTNYYDVAMGIDGLELLYALEYKVHFISHVESGRSHISKGFLKEAKELADKNTSIFKGKLSAACPLVGFEPSAILTFRDEYLRLASDKESAAESATYCLSIEEFLQREIKQGNIKANQFTTESKTIKIHGHCHQKALPGVNPIFEVLNLPRNYEVSIINASCCGMAGSFGYEKEHYELSMQIGEQSLFSKVRKFPSTTILATSGTSCRHQIFDGTTKIALHPVQILRNSLT